MSNLSDFKFGYGSEVKIPQEIVISNKTADPDNGGACCAWSVPGSTTTIVGQMWGGGGSGDATCSCSTGYPGAAGGYIEFSQVVTPGDVLTICTGGTTLRSTTRGTAYDGNPSYICLEDQWCIYTGGGCHGCTCTGINTVSNTCRGNCCNNCVAGNYGVVGSIDFWWGMQGPLSQRSTDGGYCANHHQYAPSGLGQPRRISPPYYFNQDGDDGNMDGLWPGGGGFSGSACNNSCLASGAGAAGALYLIYM